MAALTLIEALKAMPENGEKNVLGTYALSYPNLARCPFMPANQGNTHSWSIEDRLPDSNPRNINSDFSDDTGNVMPFSETVKIYGGKVKIDEFIVDTMGQSVAVQKAMQIKAKAKTAAVDMLEGTGGTNALGVNGYIAKTGSPWADQTLAAGGSLTMDHLDQCIDKVAIDPDRSFFFTTQLLTRAIKKLSRNEGSSATSQAMRYARDEFGKWAGAYDGIPVIPLMDGKGAEILTAGTIYLVTFGDQMFHGIQNGDLRAKDLSDTDNFEYFRIKHYMSYVAESVRCFCTITGATA